MLLKQAVAHFGNISKFCHYFFSELQSSFPTTYAWFNRLAGQKAFRIGLKKVGLADVQVPDIEEPSNAPGVDAAQLERIFVESKWRRKKQRMAPL